MKNKKRYSGNSLLMLVLTLMLWVVVAYGYDTNMEEGLCVDGDGDVNLDGIMCNKEITTWYGAEDEILPQMLIVLSIITAFCFVVEGLF